jgi:SAM-dependent methyltransferase
MFEELSNRPPATPWSEGGKIPWHEAAFSERMLREHLSQEHDLASRRFDRIDRHVAWIHETILGGSPARVLDLGCGPGFYSTRLAKLGHTCVGIDFSPASISHAQALAEKEGLACEFRLEDLLEADFGSGFDLALFVYGEFNAFQRAEAESLLAEVRSALSPSGALVVEAHTEECVREKGTQAPTWFTAKESVFSDEPHLVLQENAWHPEARAATERFHVLSLETGEITSMVCTTQAYSDAEYTELLRQAGFAEVEQYETLAGDLPDDDSGLIVLVARTT